MKVRINIYGQSLLVEVSIEVSEYLDQAKHKSENLIHEKRRHWDDREYGEAIIFRECNRSLYETPEQWLCRKETLKEIAEALESCTEVQRRRFLLFALEGVVCSKRLIYHDLSWLMKPLKAFYIQEDSDMLKTKITPLYDLFPDRRRIKVNHTYLAREFFLYM